MEEVGSYIEEAVWNDVEYPIRTKSVIFVSRALCRLEILTFYSISCCFAPSEGVMRSPIIVIALQLVAMPLIIIPSVELIHVSPNDRGPQTSLSQAVSPTF